MVPNIAQNYILLLGYSILYKEYNLTRLNHQKKTLLQWTWQKEQPKTAKKEVGSCVWQADPKPKTLNPKP